MKTSCFAQWCWAVLQAAVSVAGRSATRRRWRRRCADAGRPRTAACSRRGRRRCDAVDRRCDKHDPTPTRPSLRCDNAPARPTTSPSDPPRTPSSRRCTGCHHHRHHHHHPRRRRRRRRRGSPAARSIHTGKHTPRTVRVCCSIGPSSVPHSSWQQTTPTHTTRSPRVRLSVCLSQATIVSKQLHGPNWFSLACMRLPSFYLACTAF